jgi:hypothetical protein
MQISTEENGTRRYNSSSDINEQAAWARICKRLRSPGIDPEESIPPALWSLVAGRYDK